MDQAEDLEFAGSHARIVHEAPLAQRSEARLERRHAHELLRFRAIPVLGNSLRVDVQDVEEIAAGGTVRAEQAGISREQGVQRVEPDEVGAKAGGGGGKTLEVGEIPDAPVARGTQRVKLDGAAPHPLAGVNAGRFVAARGRHDEAHVAQRAAVRLFQPEAMVAGRQRRQPEGQADIPELPNAPFCEDRQPGRFDFAAQRLTLLRVNTPVNYRQQRREHGERHAEVIVEHRDRAEHPDPVTFVECVGFELQLPGIVHAMPQRRQQLAERLLREAPGPAAEIRELAPDAAQLSQALKQVARLSHGPPGARANSPQAGSRDPAGSLLRAP